MGSRSPNWVAGSTLALAADFAGFQAGSADVQPLRGLTDSGFHRLDIRVPTALGAAMGVRNAVAEARAFTADVAGRSHNGLQIARRVWCMRAMRLVCNASVPRFDRWVRVGSVAGCGRWSAR